MMMVTLGHMAMGKRSGDWIDIINPSGGFFCLFATTTNLIQMKKG